MKFYHSSLSFCIVGDIHSSPCLYGAAHPDKPLFFQAVWGCTQNWCLQNKHWETNVWFFGQCAPAWKQTSHYMRSKALRLQSQRRTRHLIRWAALQSKVTRTPWIHENSRLPSSQSASAAERSHPGSIFPPDAMFPSGFLTLISSTTFLSSGLFLSCALQFLAFKTTACILLKTTTKVTMFEMQGNTNSSQTVYELASTFFWCPGLCEYTHAGIFWAILWPHPAN